MRFVFLLFGLIFFGIGVYYQYYRITFVEYVYFGVIYGIYSLAILFSISQWPIAEWRKYLSVAADIAAITFAIIATGDSNSPLFILYIWILISQALRFGRSLLYTAQILSLTSYMIILFYYADYHQHLLETAFLILTLILLPFYLDTLLLMLNTAKVDADMANRSKTMFLANMSHELRTPLNAILGYSELLKEEVEDNHHTQYLKDINKIYKAGTHLLTLINDVLDLSKIEAGKMDVDYSHFELKQLIQEVISTCTPLVHKNHNTIHYMVEDCIGRIYSDSTKIRQTLYNLLSNACKFTNNGRIDVEARSVDLNGKEFIEISVSDTGIGISEEQQRRLFMPFIQADTSTTRKYGGTGLGLALCKRFTDMLGGTINVSSRMDIGSTFYIRLPRQRA